MKFSIIIPVYNSEEYIEKCIDSVIEQNFNDYEIIVIDDCSTDNSWNVIKKYNSNSNVIISRNEKNLGVAGTRNRGIELSKGDWITFLDSDDWLNKDALSLVMEKINEHPDIDIIQTNLLVRYGDESEKYSNLKDSIITEKKEIIENIISINYGNVKYGIYGNSRCAGGKFYRRSVINGILFPNELFIFEDGIFNLNAYNNAKKIMTYDIDIYNYRRSEQSVTRKFNKKKSEQFSKILKYIGEFVKENKEYRVCFNYCRYELMIEEIYNYVGTNLKNKIKTVKKIIKSRNKSDFIQNINLKYLSKREKIYLYSIKLRQYWLLYFEIYLVKKYKDKVI